MHIQTAILAGFLASLTFTDVSQAGGQTVSYRKGGIMYYVGKSNIRRVESYSPERNEEAIRVFNELTGDKVEYSERKPKKKKSGNTKPTLNRNTKPTLNWNTRRTLYQPCIEKPKDNQPCSIKNAATSEQTPEVVKVQKTVPLVPTLKVAAPPTRKVSSIPMVAPTIPISYAAAVAPKPKPVSASVGITDVEIESPSADPILEDPTYSQFVMIKMFYDAFIQNLEYVHKELSKVDDSIFPAELVGTTHAPYLDGTPYINRFFRLSDADYQNILASQLHTKRVQDKMSEIAGNLAWLDTVGSKLTQELNEATELMTSGVVDRQALDQYLKTLKIVIGPSFLSSSAKLATSEPSRRSSEIIGTDNSMNSPSLDSGELTLVASSSDSSLDTLSSSSTAGGLQPWDALKAHVQIVNTYLDVLVQTNKLVAGKSFSLFQVNHSNQSYLKVAA
ncbi:hypothetical protein IWQ60_000775 [Tieghemiomyces parasiticus]|uniref:Uncharacterized protein n=1 Tax=Tieghemiomyces parasiticus TaxID=78921 RepID=A0A9W8DYW5_9FUNG|nr:hypothetical protein IWQ60_000775 [Tieghemiomyces parasiticus]